MLHSTLSQEGSYNWIGFPPFSKRPGDQSCLILSWASVDHGSPSLPVIKGVMYISLYLTQSPIFPQTAVPSSVAVGTQGLNSFTFEFLSKQYCYLCALSHLCGSPTPSWIPFYSSVLQRMAVFVPILHISRSWRCEREFSLLLFQNLNPLRLC